MKMMKMKTGVRRLMLLSLVYAALLGTMSAMPLFLTLTGDAAAVGADDAQADVSLLANTDGQPQAESRIWERSAPARAKGDSAPAPLTKEGPLDIQTLLEMHRALRFPQMDIPRAGQALSDKSNPDAAIVRPVKARVKAIKA